MEQENVDIVPGSISNAVTLNRFAYANGNPVSFVDPFGLSAERGNLVNKQQPYLLVLYDVNAFSRQAEDECKYLIDEYQYDQVVTIPIDSKSEFIDAWNSYVTSADGISLVFHGSPDHLWVGEKFMKTEVASLEEANLEFLRLLSCNGGHKDISDNIAKAFKNSHNIETLYAMDGNISYYPRNWYLIGHDYSKYGPRLSFDQDGFYKRAKGEYIFFSNRVAPTPLPVYVKRSPEGTIRSRMRKDI